MYSLPGTLLSKTRSFRLHRLKHYMFEVLPCQEFDKKNFFDTVEPVKIFSFLKEIVIYIKT